MLSELQPAYWLLFLESFICDVTSGYLSEEENTLVVIVMPLL